MVVGGAINRYVYVTVRKLPPFFDYKYKLIYSKIETTKLQDEIEHKAIAAVLKTYYQETENIGLELSHLSDLSSMSGTGSSSSFIVSMVHAIAGLSGNALLPQQLTNRSIHIEQDVLCEKVGLQDTIFASFGGLNEITFKKDLSYEVLPLVLSEEQIKNLEDHLLLFFTKQSRRASAIAETYVDSLPQQGTKQKALIKLAEDAKLAIYRGDMQALGRIVNNGWQIKRSLSTAVSNGDLDRFHSTGCIMGAYGGKLTGAGGGGSLLFVAPPEKHDNIKKALGEAGLIHIPFKFEFGGSRVIFVSRDQ